MDIRTTHAHLEIRADEIYGVFKLGFKKDSPQFEYCFIGENCGSLTYEGETIQKHPTFKNVDKFEGWCRRYIAEH